MGFVRKVLVAVVAVAFAAYGFDCLAMTTPEQAMQCCTSMPCAPSSHNDQDCCKTMAAVSAPFVKPAAGHVVSLSHIESLPLLAIDASPYTCSTRFTAATCSHAPPYGFSPAFSPIRI